jgi:hypothetical protein
MIKLLDEAIETITNGSESEFAKFACIKDSTIRSWRKREEIPDDKIVLLKTLLENHKMQQKIAKYEGYFKLQNEVRNMLQN